MRIPLPIPGADDGAGMSWIVGPDDPDGVYVERTGEDDYPWQVTFAALEFVREPAAEAVLSGTIRTMLEGVHGVEQVVHEDREVWLVAGTPNGLRLTLAAERAVRRCKKLIAAAL